MTLLARLFNRPKAYFKGERLNRQQLASLKGTIPRCPDCRSPRLFAWPDLDRPETRMACGNCGSEFVVSRGRGTRKSTRGKPDHVWLRDMYGIMSLPGAMPPENDPLLVMKLKAALAYYAIPTHWTHGDVPGHIYAHDDAGSLARKTLGLPERPSEGEVWEIEHECGRLMSLPWEEELWNRRPSA